MQATVGVLLGDGDDEAQVRFDHLLLGDARFALALLHHGDDAAELGDRDTGFGGEILDLLANVADRLVFALGEFLPALAGQVADRLHPVRVEFGARILFEERVALDAVGFGKPQQAAFVLHQPLGNVVELLDQAVDAVLVERQRLDRLDQLILELLVAALLSGRKRAGGSKAGFHLLVLQLAQLLVGLGDDVEGFHDLRAQFRFHGGEREVRLVVVFLFLLGRHDIAADIGDVVVVGGRAHLAGLFLLLGSLAVSLDLFRALELRSSLGLRTGIGGFEIDDLAQQRLAFVQFVAPDDQRLERQRALTETGDHRLAASLDALGNRDFAFAGQEFDRAHLAQIHADRIVGTIGRFLLLAGRKRRAAGRGEFAAFALAVVVARLVVTAAGSLFGFLVLDHVDAHVGQHRHRVFDLFGGDFLGRKDGVELVHRHVAALLGGLDHLLDSVVGKIEKRTVRSTFAFYVSFFVFFDFGCHLVRRFPCRNRREPGANAARRFGHAAYPPPNHLP
ncbi:hypothetical protein D9M68_185640 [compost metagenome]